MLIDKVLKQKAQQAVNKAIKLGQLQREACEICGEQAIAHHEDYLAPLKVRWLCYVHHAQWHLKNGVWDSEVGTFRPWKRERGGRPRLDKVPRSYGQGKKTKTLRFTPETCQRGHMSKAA